jgi:hypothetical protein
MLAAYATEAHELDQCDNSGTQPLLNQVQLVCEHIRGVYSLDNFEAKLLIFHFR